jgi:hypothetical protein
MKTTRDIQATTRGGLPFTIPAGSPVELIPAGKMQGRGPGPLYWVRPEAFRRDSIERHDATYYGIEVTAAEVE